MYYGMQCVKKKEQHTENDKNKKKELLSFTDEKSKCIISGLSSFAWITVRTMCDKTIVNTEHVHMHTPTWTTISPVGTCKLEHT